MNAMKRIKFFWGGVLCLSLTCITNATASATFGFADVVLDYYDSGTASIPGPYGGTLSHYPTVVSPDVVLGNNVTEFLSLPKDSYVTVGFIDEIILNGVGDEIFISEYLGAGQEKAEVYVSSDDINYTFLGIALGGTVSSFDLDSIGYVGQVTSVKVVGLDNIGASPGFDLLNVQVSAVPEPSSIALMLGGIVLVGFMATRQKRACQLA